MAHAKSSLLASNQRKDGRSSTDRQALLAASFPPALHQPTKCFEDVYRGCSLTVAFDLRIWWQAEAG